MKQQQLITRTRPTEYNRLLQILQQPGPAGVVVLGELGMGKTSLVEAVLATPGIGEPVMKLHCTPSLSTIAHGALSPYLGALETIDEPVGVLRELNRSLFSARGHATPHIVVVEDAQFLDPQSCFILSLLVENAEVKVLALGNGSLQAGSPLGTLAELGTFTTVALQRLDRNGVRAVAEGVIGRRLGDGTVRLIDVVTGGNPRFVEAYAASCLEQGTLFHDDRLPQDRSIHEPVWIVARALPEIDTRLLSLGREITRGLSSQERRTLLLLALAGPQQPDLLEQCGLPYGRLVKTGELVLSGGAVCLKSRLMERIVRALASEQDTAQLHELWCAAAAELGKAHSALEVLWCLEIGKQVPSELVLACAERTARNLDFTLALRLCELGKLSQHHGQGALLEAQVLLSMGRHYAARALLLRLIDQLTDLSLLGQAYAYLVEVTTCIEADGAELERILDEWRQRAQGHPDGEAVAGFMALQSAGAQALDFWIRVNTARGPLPSVAELQDFLSDPQLPVQARFIGQIMLSDLHSSAGNCQQALELLEPVLELLKEHAPLQAMYEVRVFFRIGWNLLYLGEYERAEAFIDSYRQPRLRSIQHYQGAISLLDGISHLLQGKVQPALAKMAEAVTELQIVDTTQLLALASNLYRLLLARMGIDVPVALATAPEDFSSSGMISPSGQLGEESSEQRIFARAFAAGLGNPYQGESLQCFPMVEREILFSLTRQLGDEELAESAQGERLRALAAGQEGSRAALQARLMELRGSRLGEPLEQLAQEALSKQDYLVVIEAWARAAERYAQAGDQRRCGALLRRAARLIEQQGMHPGKYIDRVLAITELTARETEIVNLARQGLNNAQIARALTVSQRTVEGHLYRVFSKLGITERAELDHAGLEAGTTRK
ncbi:response regulator transcription factor [Glutamicibacter sp.]|uniref:response regulator transcription factor n=1 Tax=Glutamicibacter sp. TaxID=1931995 RepID=UPI003D6BDBAF